MQLPRAAYIEVPDYLACLRGNNVDVLGSACLSDKISLLVFLRHAKIGHADQRPARVELNARWGDTGPKQGKGE